MFARCAAGERPISSSGSSRASTGAWSVTKDEDFHRLSVLRGAPPKVVWIRLGNCRTLDIADLLRGHHESVRCFAEQEEASFQILG